MHDSSSTFLQRPRGGFAAALLRLLLAAASLAVVAGTIACGDDGAGAGDILRRLAPDVSVSGVSIFQSVEVPLWAGGEERTDLNAVIAEGKAAAVVVYLEPSAEFEARELTVFLGVDRGAGTRWQQTQFTPNGPSSLDRADSVVVFELPAEEVSGSLSIVVTVVDPLAPAIPPGTTHAARYPADGSTRPVPLGSATTPVRLVLLPVRYAQGGAEYVPDTSPEQLELYRETLMAAYPAVAWDIVLHEEIFWDRPPTWSGFDFGALNAHVSDLKGSEGDIPQAHYYSLVAPDASFAAYCTPMCVAGESYLVTNAEMSDLRVGAGLGFSGAESAWTMVHELGHVFGRGHSGCSVPRDDREYPYAGGLVGVWGRDPRDGRFYPPSTADFMGYCTPVWVSDFTWNRLFERLEALASLGAKSDGDPYRILHVDLEEGTSRWGADTFVGRLGPAPMVPARFGGDEPFPPSELPVVWQSDFRHASVLVPLDLAPSLVEIPGLAAAPRP